LENPDDCADAYGRGEEEPHIDFEMRKIIENWRQNVGNNDPSRSTYTLGLKRGNLRRTVCLHTIVCFDIIDSWLVISLDWF